MNLIHVNAQNSLVWHFGVSNDNSDAAILDFREFDGDRYVGVADLPSTSCNSQVDAQEGTSGFTLSDGQELFYTDGSNVWLPGVSEAKITGLFGNTSSSSSAIVVPGVDHLNDSIYHIFTVSGATSEGASVKKGVYYTKIKYNGPGKEFDVLQKNTTISYTKYNKLQNYNLSFNLNSLI